MPMLLPLSYPGVVPCSGLFFTNILRQSLRWTGGNCKAPHEFQAEVPVISLISKLCYTNSAKSVEGLLWAVLFRSVGPNWANQTKMGRLGTNGPMPAIGPVTTRQLGDWRSWIMAVSLGHGHTHYEHSGQVRDQWPHACHQPCHHQTTTALPSFPRLEELASPSVSAGLSRRGVNPLEEDRRLASEFTHTKLST
uniref:Uncharacterized protein n=1 Tax=Timema shepardi TaxID=629360 RepID=A0A7R9B793_TIMSH|nr:unnamed protein product [Timema shepardi]